MKKHILILLGVLILLVAAYLITTGFTANGSVYIADYTVSADGTQMEITVGVASSMGYIRQVRSECPAGDRLYVTPISAFGGLNGSIGARDTFTLELEPHITKICLYRKPDAYQTVLELDAAGNWVWVE